jgi:hypothetical protein
VIALLLKILDQVLHKISHEIKKRGWFVFKQFNTVTENGKSYPEIDVVIPLVPKDLDMAVLSIEAVQKYSLNPINNIYIIAPYSIEIHDFCISKQLVFINEDEIAPLSTFQIINYLNSESRIGWLKQQLIKLNCAQITGIKPNVLIMDADTILVKKQFFCESFQSIILFYSDEFHFLYKMANRFLLGNTSIFPFSFISHHQIFNIEHLQLMLNSIEVSHQKQWYFAFLDAAKKFNNYVSEYELYGQYVRTNFRTKYISQYWFNMNLKSNDYLTFRYLKKNAISVSFHNYEPQPVN